MNLPQALMLVVPGVQDLLRQAKAGDREDRTMFPTLLVLREDRIVVIVLTPRIEATLSCAETMAIGLDAQMLVVAAEGVLPEGPAVVYTTMTRDREASGAVQPFTVDGSEITFAAPFPATPEDQVIMDQLAQAMAQRPLNPGTVVRRSDAPDPEARARGVNPTFIPPSEGRLVLDSGAVRATHHKIKDIAGTVLYVAGSPEHATRLLAHGMPAEALLG